MFGRLKWWQWVSLVAILLTAVIASRLVRRQGPPPEWTIQTVCDRARSLGWDVHSGYDNGKGAFLVCREYNPRATAHGGANQEGCLYVVEKEDDQAAYEEAASFRGADYWGKFYLRGDARMARDLRR